MTSLFGTSVPGSLAAAALAVTLSASAACGGGLKYTVDDAALDAVPAAELQGVVDARKEGETAEAERASANNQLDALVRDLVTARNEREQAQLETEKTLSEQEGAKASRDLNQANSATHDKGVADFGLKVADAKIDWLNQKQDWMRQARIAAEAHIGAAKARVEFEKALIAHRRGILPAGDQPPAKYEEQWKSKEADWQGEKRDAESEEQETLAKEAKWKDLASQLRKLKGG